MIPSAPAKLLEGKRGIIIGIANDHSIAWGCAKAFRALGSELAVTYLNEKAKGYVEPLAGELDAAILMPLDVPKEALQGRVVDVERDGFLTTMEVSCWSFIRMAHLAQPLMKNGGTLFTMTYYGSQMVVKNYNVMGVAKAALEAAVRYTAAELGPKGIRVHRAEEKVWRAGRQPRAGHARRIIDRIGDFATWHLGRPSSAPSIADEASKVLSGGGGGKYLQHGGYARHVRFCLSASSASAVTHRSQMQITSAGLLFATQTIARQSQHWAMTLGTRRRRIMCALPQVLRSK
jgi:enoyl-[acyl-carrier protein] reductase I